MTTEMPALRGATASAFASAADKSADKPSLLSLMREDAHAALERDPAAHSLRDIVLYSTGTHIVWAYRRNHWLWEHGFRNTALWLAKRMRRRLGADIHPAATIGRRFTIDHGIGIVIGGTAIIGDDCMLYQGVTLGMTGKKLEGKRHPTLGDDVLVGANAVVLGDIHVDSGVRVGAGAVVVDDVPDDVTVVGVPARIVRRRGPVELRLVDDERDVAVASAPSYDADELWSCAL